MNILIFSEAAWDDKNSFGNTVTNFFCGKTWENDNFSNFYVRNQMPDNKSNVKYYQLSAIDIVKGIIEFKVAGKIFSTNEQHTLHKSLDLAHKQEQKNIDKLHQSNNQYIYYFHELIWRSKVWLNKHFDNFIKNCSPDILFAFATSPYILWPLIQYLKKNTKCKVVLLIADDTYGACVKLPWYRRSYQIQELKNCILAADKLYAISDEMAQLYKDRFNKSIKTLYKGCDLTVEPKNYTNASISFVYAGNLLWGRDDILATVAVALEKINAGGQKAKLEIYTGATITPELSDKLNRGESSQIMGSRSYDEIKQIMHDADVVLHVESFDKNTIETVRYSLSTKIIDCLQSGSQVLGIGPKGIASIEYLRKVDGAIVIDSVDDIEDEIVKIIEESSKIHERVLQIRKYALSHHEICQVQRKLRCEIEALLYT